MVIGARSQMIRNTPELVFLCVVVKSAYHPITTHPDAVSQLLLFSCWSHNLDGSFRSMPRDEACVLLTFVRERNERTDRCVCTENLDCLLDERLVEARMHPSDRERGRRGKRFGLRGRCRRCLSSSFSPSEGLPEKRDPSYDGDDGSDRGSIHG